MGLIRLGRKETSEDVIDDITFIQDMKHTKAGAWDRWDILLAASGYGWAYMIDTAAYLEGADLGPLHTLTASEMANLPETELIKAYRESGTDLKHFEPLQTERGQLAAGGFSRVLKSPVKIVWYNQTRVLTVYVPFEDEALIRRYVESVIRRNFGTKDEMKNAKPIPEKKTA
ncbi:MAG: hypothetical protein K6G61_11865 [Solobacterium sp.]|nr:hypothetical protein [Solobacterium sp.]